MFLTFLHIHLVDIFSEVDLFFRFRELFTETVSFFARSDSIGLYSLLFFFDCVLKQIEMFANFLKIFNNFLISS